ncbi:hypothetical protein D5086_031799 [Populus alba]|uniref:Uncharacterized protein n=1 Tax=Populus alba TaxID=43335 RepID=A0ACC4AJL3_POPAL
MAAMYAVYHGPGGLKTIAQRVHGLAEAFAVGLKKLGTVEVQGLPFFDTVKITVSFDETTTLEDVDKLFKSFFSGGKPVSPFHSCISGTRGSECDPSGLTRESPYLAHPIFNMYHTEHELLRCMHRLQSKDLSVCHSMIPLGSCTMKLNATSEMMPVTFPNFTDIHLLRQVNILKEMFNELGELLCTITGFDSFSLQPNAGAAGECAGLMVIRAYHKNIFCRRHKQLQHPSILISTFYAMSDGCSLSREGWSHKPRFLLELMFAISISTKQFCIPHGRGGPGMGLLV